MGNQRSTNTVQRRWQRSTRIMGNTQTISSLAEINPEHEEPSDRKHSTEELAEINQGQGEQSDNKHSTEELTKKAPEINQEYGERKQNESKKGLEKLIKCNDIKTNEKGADSDYTTSDEIPLARLTKNKRKFSGTVLLEASEYSTSDDIPIANLITPKNSSTMKKRKSSKGNKAINPTSDSSDDDESGSQEDLMYDSDEDFQVLADLDFSDIESGEDADDDDEDKESHTTTGDPTLTWTHKLQKVTKKTFTGPKPGVAIPLSSNAKELDYFYEIFPEQIFETMVKSTNAYVPIYAAAKRKQIQSQTWRDTFYKDVSIEDMKAFIGIRMIMALDPKPCLDDYWSTHPAFNNQLVSKSMSRKRFKSIQRYFHVNDPNKDPSRLADKTLAKESTKKYPLYKVSPLMERVRKNSIRKYNLHQEVSVDEAMIKCHGQHWTIVGAPNKPAKRGFKVFVAADAVTGFMWNFQVYFRRQKEIGLTQRVVENLTEDIADRNHIIFVDKFYTSVPLALSLLEKSTFLCGSFNTGRKHWPVELKVDKRKKKKDDKLRTLKRGESMARQTTDGKFVATVWQDSRTVYNLSTCHNAITNARRDKVERKHLNTSGRWEKSEFPCPEAIVEFNKYIGGVDRHDHLRSSYSLQRASVRWWTYFVWFSVDMALINAFLMYKDNHKRATHKKFQLKVSIKIPLSSSH
ncbi:piggyBac transposable element-derived protein 2-like [Mizuhopecten yessoensis]|uniref:piggyBac transposable element-derived protein 2-like n=1 Tax=Mizuhopecten yessoensis TaxID=6573 RepID=UPI000B4592C2|nr:piggyBac transposable element-derived protein 2-like [Mizuhopecten yessoensis]